MRAFGPHMRRLITCVKLSGADDESEEEEKDEDEKEAKEDETEGSDLDLSMPWTLTQPPRPNQAKRAGGPSDPREPTPKSGSALPPGALLDAPVKPPAKGTKCRKPQPACKYGGKKELVAIASHGTLWKVPSVYFIPGRWEDRRHPSNLRRLGAPRGAPVGHLYAYFFEAHPDGTMRTRLCQIGVPGYAEVEYISTHLSTLFDGISGCTKMPPAHFGASRPMRETKFSVRKNGNRGFARCVLLLARIMAHWIKEGRTSPLRSSPKPMRTWSFSPLPRCGTTLPCWLLGGATWHVGRTIGPRSSLGWCVGR